MGDHHQISEQPLPVHDATELWLLPVYGTHVPNPLSLHVSRGAPFHAVDFVPSHVAHAAPFHDVHAAHSHDDRVVRVAALFVRSVPAHSDPAHFFPRLAWRALDFSGFQLVVVVHVTDALQLHFVVRLSAAA